MSSITDEEFSRILESVSGDGHLYNSDGLPYEYGSVPYDEDSLFYRNAVFGLNDTPNMSGPASSDMSIYSIDPNALVKTANPPENNAPQGVMSFPPTPPEIGVPQNAPGPNRLENLEDKLDVALECIDRLLNGQAANADKLLSMGADLASMKNGLANFSDDLYDWIHENHEQGASNYFEGENNSSITNSEQDNLSQDIDYRMWQDEGDDDGPPLSIR